MDSDFTQELAQYGGQLVSTIAALAWGAIAGLLYQYAPKAIKLWQTTTRYKIVQDGLLWAAKEALALLRNPDRTDVEDERSATRYAAEQLERRVPDALQAVGVTTRKQLHDLVAVRVRDLLWKEEQ